MGLFKKKQTNAVYVCACANVDAELNSDMSAIGDIMNKIGPIAVNSLLRSNDKFGKEFAKRSGKQIKIFPQISTHIKDVFSDEAIEQNKNSMIDYLAEKNVKNIDPEKMYMTTFLMYYTIYINKKDFIPKKMHIITDAPNNDSQSTIDMSAVVYLDI